MLPGEFANVSGVAWSRDGREIWFSAVDCGVRQRLYAVTASPDATPAWSATCRHTCGSWTSTSTGRVLVASRYTRLGIRGQLVDDTKEHDVGWLDYSVAVGAIEGREETAAH